MSIFDNFVTVSKRIEEVQSGNENRRYVFYRLLVTYIHYAEQEALVRRRKKEKKPKKRKKKFCFMQRSNHESSRLFTSSLCLCGRIFVIFFVEATL